MGVAKGKGKASGKENSQRGTFVPGKNRKNKLSKKKLAKLDLKDLQVKKNFEKIGLANICAVKPTSSDVDAIAISSGGWRALANTIVAKVNQECPTLPGTGKNLTSGMVALYLMKAFGAYLIRVGIWKSNYSDVPAMNSLVVPAWIAVLFQNSAVYHDPVTGGRMSLVDSSYPTELNTANFDEGQGAFKVQTGVSTGNEPVMGVGALLVYASLTESVAASISRKITAAFPYVVPVQEIALFSKSLTSFPSTYGNSIKPVADITTQLVLQKANVPLFPNSCSTAGWSQLAFSAAAYLFEETPYDPNSSINSLFKKHKIDPYKFSYNAVLLHWSVVCEVVMAWCIKNKVILVGMSGATAWNLFINILTYFSTSYIAQFHWISRFSGQNPCYVDLSMKGMNCLVPLVAMGTQPFVQDHCLVIPYWNIANGVALVSLYQINQACSALYLSAVSANNIITGTTSSTTVIAGFSPFNPANVYNFLPLKIIDSLATYIDSQNGTLPNQSSLVANSCGMCRCWTYRSISDNDLVISTISGSDMQIFWANCNWIVSSLCMSPYDCSCQASVGIMVCASNSLSRFTEEVEELTGQGVLFSVNAAQRDSNFDNMNAAMKGKDPSKALLAQYRSRILDMLNMRHLEVDPAQVVDIMKSAKAIGLMPESFDPEILNHLNDREWDLNHLVSVGATLLGTYGPSVLRAFNSYRSLRVRSQ